MIKFKQLPPEMQVVLKGMSDEELAEAIRDFRREADRVLLTLAALGETEWVVEAGSTVAKGEVKMRVHLEVLDGNDTMTKTVLVSTDEYNQKMKEKS